MKTNRGYPDYYELTGLSIASVSGDDAKTFLQGQLSNDIAGLSESSPHQLSAYCNPKGRILALFHVFKVDEGYLLAAPVEILHKVLPRLRMFVMRSAVEITPLADLSLQGLYAPGFKASELKSLQAPDTQIARHHNDPGRYFLLAKVQATEVLKSNNEWNRLDIEQNLPQIYLNNYEALLPQSVNLDIVDGVNFKKGCFPGQEIIARIKYRGKPKTRMIGVTVSTSKPPAVGDSVFINGRNSPAGQVINIASDAENTLLSISVPVTHISRGSLYLDEDRTIELKRLTRPYEIPV